MNPLFCFDIDGTLLDNIDQKFHESEIQTLKDLKKAGYKISIATGRSFQSVKSTGLLDLVEWDGLVLNNGQVVCDRFGNIQHIIYIEDESFQRLKKFVIKKIGTIQSKQDMIGLPLKKMIQIPYKLMNFSVKFFHE